MSDMPVIMNQTEAAQYISEHYKPMDPSTLSRLTSHGVGPKHQPKGNQKLFYRRDVDAWIDAQKESGGWSDPRSEKDADDGSGSTNNRPEL
ncbi:MAG: helix-turn-helix transcriptional regulator [Persicimonas sp.]